MFTAIRTKMEIRRGHKEMAILVIIGILQLATMAIMLNRIEASVDDCYIALEELKCILHDDKKADK